MKGFFQKHEVNSKISRFNFTRMPDTIIDETGEEIMVPGACFSVGRESYFDMLLGKYNNQRLICQLQDDMGHRMLCLDMDVNKKDGKKQYTPEGTALLGPRGLIYGDKEIIAIVKNIQQFILSILPTANVACCVMKKKEFKAHGFHIQFIKLFTKKENIKFIVEYCSKTFGFDNVTHSWMVYGHEKTLGSGYYEPVYLVKEDGNKIEKKEMNEWFCDRIKIEDNDGEKIDLDVENIEDFYGFIFHAMYTTYRADDCICSEEIPVLSARKAKQTLKKKDEVKFSPEVLEECKKLVWLLSDARADAQATWMQVGWCLHNITEGDDGGFELWDEFSKRSDKYMDGECERLWRDMKEGSLGIGSLKHWAKEDNLAGYTKMFGSLKLKLLRI